MHLVGRNIAINTPAAPFVAVSSGMEELHLSDFSGKIKLITSFPSLDTPVCDLQVKEFNKRAAGLSKDIAVFGISRDLPFAQKRFCESFGIKNIFMASDYKYSSFGINYGLLIKELNLLARAVLILDRNNMIRYIEIVNELTQAPDYQKALNTLVDIVASPEPPAEKVLTGCKPCELGAPPLPAEKVSELISSVAGWQLAEGKKIMKEFKFKDFSEAKFFLDLLASIAQEQGHHPSFTLNYNKLKITLTTHASGGLTESDFIMARLINEAIEDH